jgi:DNA-binding transcriptional ArsR family regulator
MLYFYHMSGDAVNDLVFRALGNPTRRALLDLLRDTPRTTGDLCTHFPHLDRCTVMQHLRVLEAADLVIPRREGRERWNHLNPLPIKEIHDRWIGPYAARAVGLLQRMKGEMEGGVAPDEEAVGEKVPGDRHPDRHRGPE